MVNNPQELITTLKAQHRGLQSDLTNVLGELKSETVLNASAVISKLAKFKEDLIEHLKLENGEFYPDYLHKKEIKGENIAQTKEFIGVMENIGKVVIAFLDKYDNIEAIESSRLVFDNEFNNIIRTLNTRIETEEEGVYEIYLVT